VFGWKITGGSWQGEPGRLSVVGVIRSVHTLGNVYEPVNPVRAVLIVDSRADAEQRLALQSFARHMGGALLGTSCRWTTLPFELTIQDGIYTAARPNSPAGSLAAIQTRAMQATDHTCGNEDVFYPPLTALDHAMPAYALADSYQGDGLAKPGVRSAPQRFPGTFHVASDRPLCGVDSVTSLPLAERARPRPAGLSLRTSWGRKCPNQLALTGRCFRTRVPFSLTFLNTIGPTAVPVILAGPAGRIERINSRRRSWSRANPPPSM